MGHVERGVVVVTSHNANRAQIPSMAGFGFLKTNNVEIVWPWYRLLFIPTVKPPGAKNSAKLFYRFASCIV
jgi:hypothetical protein